MKKRRVKIFLSLALVLCVTCVVFIGCAAKDGVDNITQYAETEVPLTDLAATYSGEATDSDGNLLAPFDVVYHEEFLSGNYKYDRRSALLKFGKNYDGTLLRDLMSCGFVGVEKVSQNPDGTQWYRAFVGEQTDVETAVKKARSLKVVLIADFDYIYEDSSYQTEDDGSSVSSLNDLIDDVLGNIQVRDQWYLTACDIQKSWRWLKKQGVPAGGSSSVTVAVIDTGVDYNHPDLKANMWVNPGEIPGNGIDDDGDGYIDDVYGCSTVSDARFHSGDPMDDHGHGTHVAGIIAASNNKTGIVGVAYNAKIMAIKAGQATGVFLQSDIAEAIIYAYTHGADVINMSFGGGACSIAVQDALQAAYTTSTLVAAAGNDGYPNEPTDYYPVPRPSYPGALSYVVGVMSVNALGVESLFTNWDARAFNSVEYEVYAPGEAMLSTLPNNRYGKLNGTSMAAPVVSGIAALLRSYYTDRDMYPSKFIAAQLCATSEDKAICCLPEKHTVDGLPHNLPMMTNAYAALTKLPKPDVNLFGYYLFDSESIDEANNGDGVIDAGETINIGAILRNRWGMSKNTVVTIDALSSLEIANPYVEMVTDTVNFDGVGTYSTKDNLMRSEDGVITGTISDLKVKISETCPNNYLVKLNLRIFFENGIDAEDKQVHQSKGLVEFYVRNGILIPDRITEDLTLKNDKYYIAPYGFYVAENATLKIEAGTTIEFFCDSKKDPYSQGGLGYVLVDGKLIVEGEENNLVRLVVSEQHKGVSIQFTSREQGEISMSYTLIENMRLSGSTIKHFDHCIFTDNGSRPKLSNAELYQCKFKDWEGFVDYCYFDGCAFIQSHTISESQCGNNVFRNCVIDTGEQRNNVVYMEAINVYVSGLVEETAAYSVSLGVGGTYLSNRYTYYMRSYIKEIANYFDGDMIGFENGQAKISIPKNKLSVDSIEELNKKIVEICEKNNLGYFSNNAILNNYSTGDLWDITRITAKGSGTKPPIINIKGNYWGTLNKKIINDIIYDYDDDPAYQDIVFDEILTSAPENTFPFVTDAYVLNSNGERARTVSNETCTFVVEFNRDMDTTVPLRLRFGSSKPYAEYEISGKYVSARRWEGTYTLNTTIENGIQYFKIENGHAKGDSFLTLCDGVRFSFEIDTTAAQAMIMQGEATETGVKLTWQQDDFDTLLGYNVYRSDKEDGLYTRLNDYVLAADENEFFDSTVEPGKLYYYNFTVVKTDMSESTPSGKIVIRAMDTMAPNIYHSPVRTAYTGKNLVISATITDNLQITSATLYYRAVGGEWKTYKMYNNNSRYYGIVGAESISLAGLEYYIDAFDGVSHTYNGTAEKPYLVTVKVAVDDNSLGDVDGDGVITNKDALMLLQAANDKLNLTEEQFMRADIDKDGVLSAAEAMRILQYVSGKIGSIV